MKFSFEYKGNEERQQIIEQNADKTLIEEQNHTNGNFLVFTDSPPTHSEIEKLKEQNTKIMLALADLSAAVVGGSENG